ncbi:cysteine proteinase [Ganoderma leucocontextum]|nr:cysteine proteinase [Ganoderma leucocontextum]
MASPHTPYHPQQPGPSYYHPPPPHPPPPHYPYSQAPGPAPYYAYPMPPINGHAPMHQPASPRINGAGRGRFNPHRGGAPPYHYPHLPPQHHMQPPTVPVQTPPPVSPASPFHHPQKFPPHPHPHQVPYGSPYHHPQPNGPYPPAWAGQTLSPLPKHLPMLPPMGSPEHVPQLQQPQLPHLPQPQPQPPPDVPPQPHPMPSNVAEEAIPQVLSPQVPRVVTQLVDIPLPEPSPSMEAPPVFSQLEDSGLQPEQPEQIADAVPLVEEAVEEPVVEPEPRPPTPRSPSSPLSTTFSDSSIYVVWSRRPRDPSHAPGVIISCRAFPPEDIVQKASDLRTPPASPMPVRVGLVKPSTPPVQDVSPELSAVPSSSTTETTPAGSLVADTPVPGSPYSCATSISAAVESPSKALVSPHAETRLELPPPAADVVPKESEPTTQPPAEQPALPVASTSSAPAPAAKVPSLPKKSWTSLFQTSESAASTSKPRLPVSNVVGISISAATGAAVSSTPGASIATANRSELLHLLNDGPSGSSANFAAAMKIRPRGLVNTGNMCFANAVLQILIYCPPFHRFFSELKKHLAGPVVGSQREGTKATPLVDATIQFLKEFVPDPPANTNPNPKSKGKEREDDSFDELDSFIPTYVYDAMKEKKRFANMIGGHQEDAEEFLGFFLDTLEEELLSIAQPLQPKEAAEAPEEPQDDGWLEVGKKNKAVATRTAKSTESPITRIFGGKFRSTLRTPHQRESVTIEDWRSLQLDIQPENVTCLRDALQHISHPQPVQISIPTRPGALLDAQQQVLIDALPPVLILHMKRFLYDTKVGDVIKVGKQVSFASELDVPSDIISATKRTAQPVKYELFGVLYHHGPSAHGGHYTLDVLHPNRELSDRPRPAWIRIDDELVSDVRPEDVFGGQEREDRQPYLLFYRRMTAWAPARTN